MTSFFGASQSQPVQPAISQPISQTQQNSLQEILQNAFTLTAAVSGPEFYGDERDRIISLLNQLLASSGIGNGYFRFDQPPFAFGNNNIFHRLKAVGYNQLGRHKNSDGLVSFTVKSSPANFEPTQTQNKIKVIDTLNAILRQKQAQVGSLLIGQQNQQRTGPDIAVELKSINPIDEQHTELIFVARERGGRGLLPANLFYHELAQHSNELAQQLHCGKVVPLVEIEKTELDNYLQKPPPGFEEIWAQAIRENPDPANLVPYPIQGFQQLFQRKKRQLTLISSLDKGLDDCTSRLAQVQDDILATRSRYAKLLQTQKLLSNRLLRVLSSQALLQRYGMAVDEKEEMLQSRLECVNFQLNGPGRLKEHVTKVFEKMRRDYDGMRSTIGERSMRTAEAISDENVKELKRCLLTRQSLLENLVSTITENAETLKIIEHSRGKK